MRFTKHITRRHFIPVLEQLEQVSLMTVANIASFGGPIITDPQDIHHGYAFPGMKITVAVALPPGYYGIKTVTYFIDSAILPNAHYSPDSGYEEDGSFTVSKDFTGQTISPQNGSTSLYALIYQGDYFEEADVFAYTSPSHTTTQELTDGLTLTVQVPSVSGFTVNMLTANQFTAMTGTKPDPNGDKLGFTMLQANGGPGVVFDGTVTNNTKYTLTVGFIQEMKINHTITYSGSNPITGSTPGYGWDGTDGGDSGSEWYNSVLNFGYWQVAPGASVPLRHYPNPMDPNTYELVNDSPALGVPPANLQSLTSNFWFQTHVAVMGGQMPGGGPPPNPPPITVRGVPVGLSTAYWSAQGTAQLQNGTWTQSNVNPSGPMSASGDNIFKFLLWSQNASKALADFAKSVGGTGAGAFIKGANARKPLDFDQRAIFFNQSKTLNSAEPRFPSPLQDWIIVPMDVTDQTGIMGSSKRTRRS